MNEQQPLRAIAVIDRINPEVSFPQITEIQAYQEDDEILSQETTAEEEKRNYSPLDLSIKVPLSNAYNPSEKILLQSRSKNVFQALSTLREYLKRKILAWNVTGLEQDIFILPSTVFKQKKDDYQLKSNRQIQLEVRRREPNGEESQQKWLTRKMCSQIWRDSTFEVNSGQEANPQKWKVSGWIFRGQIGRKKSFYYHISQSFRYFYQLKYCLYKKNLLNDYGNCCEYPRLARGIYNTYLFVLSLLAIILGLPGWQYPNLKQQTEKELYELIVAKVAKALRANKIQVPFELLSLPDQQVESNDGIQKSKQLSDQLENEDQKKELLNNKIINALKNLENNTCQMSKQWHNEAVSQLNENDAQFYKQINQIKFQKLCDFVLNAESIIPDKIFRKRIVEYLTATEIVKRNVLECANLLSQINEADLFYKVKVERPIKSLFREWADEFVKKQIKEQKRKAIVQRNNKIIQELREKNLPYFETLFETYVKALADGGLRRSAENQAKNIVGIPIDKIVVQRRLLIKEIKKNTNYGQYDQSQGYYIEKFTKYEVRTTIICSRFIVLILRWWAWSINTMHWLLRKSYYGPFGLKVIFACHRYARHEKLVIIDSKPKIVPDESRGYIIPIRESFSKLLDDISQSRRDFENSENPGLFPKCCERICNLMECYILGFFFTGVLGILICQPSVVILNFIVCFILALTSFAWIPIVLLFHYVLSVFFHDFDNKQSEMWSPLTCNQCFPLPYLLFVFLFKGLLQIIWSISLFILQLFFAIFCFIFAFLYLMIRTAYDMFMYLNLKCCGIIPSQDSCLVKKKSGPAHKQQTYYQIKIDEAQELVMAYLEKKELDVYENIMLQLLSRPILKSQQIADSVFGSLNTEYKVSEKSQAKMVKILRENIQEPKQLFPFVADLKLVRFSEAEIHQLMQISEKIVWNFIQQRRYMQNSFDQFQVVQGNYTKLTEQIIKQIFDNSEVLQPIDKVEQPIIRLNYEQLYINNQLINMFNQRDIQIWPGESNVILDRVQLKQQIKYEFAAEPPTLKELIQQINSNIDQNYGHLIGRDYELNFLYMNYSIMCKNFMPK